MWTRKELKQRGKERFKANYWTCVLVALILSIVVSGGSSGGSGANTSSNTYNQINREESKDNSSNEVAGDTIENDNSGFSVLGNDVKDFKDKIETIVDKNRIAIGIAVVIIMVVILLIVAIAIALDVFICNPLEVGCRKFFVENLTDNAKLGLLGTGFSKNYRNVIKVSFFRDLYTALWSLLFVIPGIVKAYEYRMIPYLLADNPDMTMEDAFAISKNMMDGNKWNAFVLDLSFIGWELLAICTCGILSVFYVGPYVYQTEAALYDTLLSKDTVAAEYDHYVEVE